MLSSPMKCLSNDQILAWNKLALSQEGRSVLGSKAKISGDNLYTGLNHWIVACGGTALAIPPALVCVENPGAATIACQGSTFTFTLASVPADVTNLKLVIKASEGQFNGETRAHSKAVAIKMVATPSTSAVDIAADYTAKHGAPSAAAPKIFFRYYLVDSSTGVKSQTMLVRYPDLKLVVPHCDSFLPNALPRFKGLLPVMIKQEYMQPVDVDANLSRLYFDLAGAATDDAIRSLLTITSADHILYGSDYPYVSAPALVSAKESLQQRLPALGLTPQAILSDNARRLFGDDIPVREYGERIVRLAEIEVFREKLEDYMGFASEVGLVSMASEPGVIALFSMQDKADPCKIYILEVYADREAYQAHLQTAHFRKYKEGTADMVKSLKLIDANPLVTAEFLKKAQ